MATAANDEGRAEGGLILVSHGLMRSPLARLRCFLALRGVIRNVCWPQAVIRVLAVIPGRSAATQKKMQTATESFLPGFCLR